MDQPNDDWGISSLPPEVMVKIFEFLTFNQLRTVSLTCKKWYQIAFSSKFSRNMRINFGKYWAVFENIHAYQNYRNVCVRTDNIYWNQCAIAEFFKTAPIEMLMIKGLPKSLDTLLNDHLLSMKELTALEVYCNEYRSTPEAVLTICHPSLKSLKVHHPGNTLKINCPNLTDLSITCTSTYKASGLKKFIQPVIQLQQQLQSLHVEITGNQQLQLLATTKLNNLKKLRLDIKNISNGNELSINWMLNLLELHLYRFYRVLGEELGVLKKLSKLKLDSIAIDTAGFEKALREMKDLKDLDLGGCSFIPATQSWHISSEYLRNLTVNCEKDYPILLPHCLTLKNLKLFTSNREIDGNFVQACNNYPQLEKLHIEASTYPQSHRNSLSSMSFSHLKQLKLLRELHLDGLVLENVDWTACSSMDIQKLWLENCEIRDTDGLQWIRLLSSELQQLILSFCNKFAYTFEIDEKFVVMLRKALPRCRISCDYCLRRGKKRERE